MLDHPLPIQPVDVPKLRAGAVAFFTRFGREFFAACIERGIMPLRAQRSVEDDAADLAGREITRLSRAELFFVSEDMTDLAIAAADSLPDFSITADDIPSKYGLIVFAKPIKAMPTPEDEYDDVTNICAASWGPSPIPSPAGAVWISWYSDKLANLATADPGRNMSERVVRIDVNTFGRLAYDNEENVPFGAKVLISSLDGRVITTPENAWPQLQTAWLLMQQPVTSTAPAEFGRSDRRRLERQGIDDRPVRVITLRRRKHGASTGESDREYHHQWIVRGHWRQQWYASRGVHRPVWIAPHIKGPEGAPMLGGEKVHAWTR